MQMSIDKKYLIDTEENKKFLEDVRNTLFNFGHKFPSPGGGSYYLGDDGTPWKESMSLFLMRISFRLIGMR